MLYPLVPTSPQNWMMANLEWAVQVLGKAWRNTIDNNKEPCTLKNSKLMEDLVVHPIPLKYSMWTTRRCFLLWYRVNK